MPLPRVTHRPEELEALLATKSKEEKTAVAWGDPHVKAFFFCRFPFCFFLFFFFKCFFGWVWCFFSFACLNSFHHFLSTSCRFFVFMVFFGFGSLVLVSGSLIELFTGRSKVIFKEKTHKMDGREGGLSGRTLHALRKSQVFDYQYKNKDAWQQGKAVQNGIAAVMPFGNLCCAFEALVWF